MATEGRGEHAAPAERGAEIDIPVAVHSCSRVGLQANPPGFTLMGRWRR